MTCLCHGYDCPKKTIEHIYVISTGYTLNKILIIYIYTWYILLLHFVYKNGSNPSVGAASLALGLLRRMLRRSRPPMGHHGVGLPCLQRNFFSDRDAALIVGLGKALVNVPRCSQQTQAYRVVCVIRRVNASTLATEWATRACQCIQ